MNINAGNGGNTVMPSNSELAELHGGLLQLLKKFHEVCLENNILYSLHGGTMLGAVREKGFIPWDDDLDISLMRSEYEKLKECLKKTIVEDDKEYALVTAERFARFVQYQKGKLPLCVDLFVYDYISESKYGQWCKITGLMLLGGLLRKKETLVLTREKNYSKIQYAICYGCYLVGRLLPYQWRYAWFEWFSKKRFCGKRKKMLRSNDQYSGMKIILPVEYMSEFILLPFEDTELMVTRNYHEVLISSYGEDYMKPLRYDQTETHNLLHSLLSQNGKEIKGNLSEK